eukprot:3145105-Prymnesium_polylepis.2
MALPSTSHRRCSCRRPCASASSTVSSPSSEARNPWLSERSPKPRTSPAADGSHQTFFTSSWYASDRNAAVAIATVLPASCSIATSASIGCRQFRLTLTAPRHMTARL